MSAGQVAAAVAAVALAALAIGRRRKLGTERMIIGLLIAAGLGVYAGGLLDNLPNVEKLIEDLAEALGQGTYALVAVLAFLETGAFVGLVAPGEFTVIIGGVIAGQGTISVIPLLGLVWLACVLGDSTSFLIGKRLGRQFLEKHGPKVKITHERLAQVDEYFERHGGKTIVIGRFVGLVRALAPFIAGSSGLQYRRFIPFSVIGTGLWATFFTLLGYFFYHSFDTVANYAGRATFVFGTLVFTILAIRYAYKRLRHEEERRRLAAWFTRQGERPLLRPFAAVVRPVTRHVVRPVTLVAWPRVKFFFRRLMPGDLGLELTSAFAIAGVGFYVFVALTVDVAENPSPTAFDTEVLDLADRLFNEMLVDVARVLTTFGALYVVGALVLAGAVVLAMKRRPVELSVLVLSSLAIFAVVHITKGALDRPRPAEGLTDARYSAFPSGHAAYSTAYVAMAVIAARVLHGILFRASFVLVAVAVAAVVGGSRIYLRVHWWSDVVAGWALGAAIFGLFGAVGMVVDYVRNNEHGEPEPEPVPAAAPKHA